MKRRLWLMLLPAWLVGCDQLSERAGFPSSARQEADGKAIGGACRHAGRGLEDCYRMNKAASKAAVYAGWKEMNEYMAKNNMQTVEPSLSPPTEGGKKADAEAAAEGKSAAGAKAGKKEPAGDKQAEAKAKEAAH